MRLRIFLAAAIAPVYFMAVVLVIAPLFLSPAYAADGSTITLAPLLSWLGGTVGSIIATVVSSVILWLVTAILVKYLTKLGINLTDDQWAVVSRAAAHWAAQWWANEDASLATAQIKVGDPKVAIYAQYAINDIPKIAAALGLTPQTMQRFIVDEIGRLQAKALSVAVPPAKA